MSHVGYIVAAWGLTLGTGAVYALHLVRRGRSLAGRVAPERRRWMTSAEPEAGDAP